MERKIKKMMERHIQTESEREKEEIIRGLLSTKRLQLSYVPDLILLSLSA